MTRAKSHERTIAERCLRDARARAGAGWDLLGPGLHEALVAREVLSVLFAAMLPAHVTKDELRSYAQALHAETRSLLGGDA